MNNKIKLKGKLKNYMRWPIYIAILMALMTVPAFFYDVKSGVCLLVFTIVYAILSTVFYKRSKQVITREMVNFATKYSSVQKKLLNEFEIPYALLDNSGKILWFNEMFAVVAGIDVGYKKSITTIFSSITREFLKKAEHNQSCRLEINENLYRAVINRIAFQDIAEDSEILELNQMEESLMALYLFDETELVRSKQRISDQKQVSALVYIDNYEEALDSIEEVKRSLLVALIDRKVSQYFTKYDGITKKIEKDKYFVVFKHKYLEEMKEEKFKILEDVKGIKVGNEMAITLSIGIGFNDDNYNENYEFARAAIDVALGRGGDQAIVKERDNISYYGGKVKQVESKNRVKARVKAQALQELMGNCENVLIMGHKLSDVDSLGAAIAIYCAAKYMGKKAQIVINEATSTVRPLMECFSVENGYPADLFVDSAQAIEMAGKNSLIMVVDNNRPSYTECPELLKKSSNIVVFDHHRQTNEVIENPVLSYIETYASSACEMVAEVLQYFGDGIKLNSYEADCIYAGILIDTNNFMTKTGVRTFEAAAYLKRAGAEVTRVRKILRNDMSCYKARAQAVRDAEVYKGSFAIAVCPSEDVESPTIVGAQAANELLNIIGIKASFVFTDYNGRIYISSRSIDEINVQIIMEKLGGGGHMNVAGAQLPGSTIAEAQHKLKAIIDEMLKEGDIE